MTLMRLTQASGHHRNTTLLKGDANVKKLCERFRQEGPDSKRAFRDYVDRCR